MTLPQRLLQLHGVVIDLIYHVKALPQSGQEAIVTRFETSPGGGFNAMVAAKRSGLPVTYAGAIGAGPFGKMVADSLRAEEIEQLTKPSRSVQDQGCCTVMIEPSGERSFVSWPGAEGALDLSNLGQIPLTDFSWTLLSGYSLHNPGSRDAMIQWLWNTPSIPNLVFDPSPVIPAIPDEAIAAVMARALWISANASEAAVLTGETDPEKAARVLAANRPETGGALVRCGADGCILAQGNKVTAIPGYEVLAIDTNGAGDCHLGAFIAALAMDETPQQAALYANVAAALSTTSFGPATAPERAIVEQTLQLKRAG